MEKLLDDNVADQVKEVFKDTLQNPVHLIFFGSEARCEYCEPTLALLEEIVSLNEKISLTVYDMDKEPELAEKYHVDKTPGIVIAAMEGDKILDYGIRYAGMPSGHEFTTLINDFIMVSQRASGLKESTREFLSTVDKDILLQVFVTPT